MARKALPKAIALTPASTAIIFAVIRFMPHIAPFLCPKLVPLCPSAAFGRHGIWEDEGDAKDSGDWEPWLATPERHERQLLWCRAAMMTRRLGRPLFDHLVGAGEDGLG